MFTITKTINIYISNYSLKNYKYHKIFSVKGFHFNKLIVVLNIIKGFIKYFILIVTFQLDNY